jgi:hypothetical protein
MLPSVLLLSFLISSPSFVACDITPAESLAAQFSLTTSTSIPFPTATQASQDAQSHIVSNWSLSKGRIQNGASDLAFVQDPFPNSTTPGVKPSNKTGPVLQVTYPQGSFSHDSGGAQLYSLWNTSDGSVFQSMMVTYEVAFDRGFDWVKGGKLPGLRGGSVVNGCDGGSKPNGSDCFSTRLMWRRNGEGEVYSYIPTPNGLCKENDIDCNDDFGISMNRKSFTFASGEWNRVTILIQLNNPPDIANGNLMMYYNDVEAVKHQNLQFRSSTNVNAGGLYLSTFFGGNDKSWATPNTVNSYFRNFQLWGGSAPSTLTGSKVNSASGLATWRWGVSLAVVTLVFIVGQ